MVFKKLRRLRKKKGEKSKPAAARPTPHSPTASRGTAHGFPKTKDISDLFFLLVQSIAVGSFFHCLRTGAGRLVA